MKRLFFVCIAVVLALSFLLVPSSTLAGTVPQPGDHVYGLVVGAEQGMVVEAKVSGHTIAETTVDANSWIGWNTPFVVPSYGGGQDGAEEGEIVEYYIVDKKIGEKPHRIFGLSRVEFVYDDKVTLTLNLGEGGASVSPAGITEQSYKDRVMIQATADIGYTFKEWAGDIATIEDPYSESSYILMKSNYTITATFMELPKVKLSMNADGRGQALPWGITEYPAGTEVAITAIPEEGWEFIEWTGMTTYITDPTNPNTTVKMLGDIVSVCAVFKPVPTLLQVTMEIPWDVPVEEALTNMPYPVISHEIVE